ncbi:MAG: putative ABC transporter permease [Candidatus Saccharibacteria bacterium]|nr:putative ABC transporter permease [Candidatus Saccharibacteria bacterium]
MSEKTKTQKTAPKRLFELERRKDYFNLGVLIFTLGSVFGTYYERIFMYVTLYIHQGIKLWLPRTGLIYGPLSPIYGAGALLVFIMICRWRNKKWYEYFVYGFFIGGVLEYVMAVGQELLFGTRSWDYSDKYLNIGGKTTIPYMFVWGAIVVAFIYLVFPLIFKLYKLIPRKIGDIIFKILAIFLIFDILISGIAVYRQNLRRHGIEPRNFIERYCDTHYPDDLLNGIYENAVPVERNKQ